MNRLSRWLSCSWHCLGVACDFPKVAQLSCFFDTTCTHANAKIPVVYADGWLPPFSSTSHSIVDWEECALFIDEDDASVASTMERIRAVDDRRRCEMMRCGLRFWDEYASTRVGWLRAILLWVRRDWKRRGEEEAKKR